MENTLLKRSKIAIIIYSLLITGVTAWSIFSIYKGALSFHSNPIDSNVFKGGDWFGGLFIFGFIISLCTGWDNYKAIDTYASGRREENVTDGCIATLLSNFLIKPAIVTVIIYYILYFLIEIGLFLLPYITGGVLLGGIVLLSTQLLRVAEREKTIPLIIIMVCFAGIYGSIGYFLASNVTQDAYVEQAKPDPQSDNHLKGTWKLVSKKTDGRTTSFNKCTLTMTDSFESKNKYKMTETVASQKYPSTYSLMSNTIVMRLKTTGDTMDNQYSIIQLDNKKLILTFVYQPEETISGELVFEKE